MLLEILLSITVIALFAPILMRSVVSHYRRQVDRLEAFERRRIADWTFSEVKERLLRQSIPWNQLPAKGESIELPGFTDIVVAIPQLQPRTFSRTCILKCKRQKEGKQQEIYRIYDLEVVFSKTSSPKKQDRYHYPLLIMQAVLPAKSS